MARLAALVLGLLVLGGAPARAEMDASEYEVKTSTSKPEDRRRELERLLEERRREEERLAAEAAAEQEAERRRRAALDDRPTEEKLLESRCTLCHPPSNYEDNGHNLAGWGLVVLRMRLLNDCEIGLAEGWTIAAHLADLRPATGWAAIIESAATAAAAMAPVGGFVWNRRRGRRKP